MSNPYSYKSSDFNATTGKGLEAVFKQVAILVSEGIKAVALMIKHLLMTFLGK